MGQKQKLNSFSDSTVRKKRKILENNANSNSAFLEIFLRDFLILPKQSSQIYHYAGNGMKYGRKILKIVEYSVEYGSKWSTEKHYFLTENSRENGGKS